MLINLSYDELFQIATALVTIENVFGTTTVIPLHDKVERAMEVMDNAPVTDVYPGIFRGRGDSST